MVTGLSPLLADSPVVMMDPVYGELNPSFTDFVAPGKSAHALLHARIYPADPYRDDDINHIRAVDWLDGAQLRHRPQRLGFLMQCSSRLVIHI